MIERVDRVRPTTAAWQAIFVATGVVALWSRIALLNVPPAARVPLLGSLYLSIAAASMLIPAGRDRSRVSPSLILGVGLAGVGLAAVASGRVVPAPLGIGALPLSLVAAVAEEALFRRAAYGWLRRWGAPMAIGASALAFALVHVPLYGAAAIPVDLGAGLMFSWQRWASGDWTVPAATHAAANALAVVLR